MFRKSKWLHYTLVVLIFLSLMSIDVFAATKSFFDGQLTIVNSAGSASSGANTYTAEVGSTWNAFAATESTITFTNASTNSKVLSFSWAISKDNGSTLPPASPYEVTLSAGASVSFTLKSATFSVAKWTITNITFEDVAAGIEVICNYDNTLGTVQTTAGSSVSPGSPTSVEAASGEGLTAVASSGATFLGWIATDGKVLSTESTYIPNAAVTLRAVFTNNSGTAYFGVGSLQTVSSLFGSDVNAVPNYAYLFDSLTDANNYANSSTLKYIVLLNSGTLQGAHTISSGVTLLIPFDSDNTLFTSEPEAVSTDVSAPSAYRTLTLSENATIAVNGMLSVSCRQQASSGNRTGTPTGSMGVVKLHNGSNITVNSGGKLYAWGYISRASGTSEGSVTIKSGGEVNEFFQVMDWRGGNCSSKMVNNESRVFPFSQYYVQNVEVPMTLEAGATEKARIAIEAVSTRKSATFTFIGQDAGTFRMSSGSVTKDFLEDIDKLAFVIAGDGTLANIQVNISVLTYSMDIDSANYVLPLNNMSIAVESGAYLTSVQDVALIPGTTLEIKDGSTLDMGANSLFIYDLDNWGGYAYGQQMQALYYAHGRANPLTSTRTIGDASLCINGTLTGGSVYTTAANANVYSTGYGKFNAAAGSAIVTSQATQDADNKPVYHEISINPAILQNGDTQKTATVETAGVPVGTTFYYHPEHQRWIPVPHDAGTDKQICACGLTNYSFRYSNQIGWDGTKTMWYLKSNLYVQLGDKILDRAALSALNYGVFFMTETEWTNYKSTYADANSLTKPSIAIMKEAGKEYKKDVAASVADGDKGAMVTAELQDYFLTSQLEDENIYVLFYIVDEDSNGNPLHCFGQVMTRNLKALANTAYSDTTGRFDAEKSIYGVMIGVLQTVEEHQFTFTSIPAMPSYMSAAPSVGYFGPTSNAGLAVKHSASVVLIEPWGLRLNGYISGSFDDYGLVILNDRDREYRYEMPSPQQLMANPDAQVYSVSDGSAAVNFGVDIGTGSFTQITTDYIGDLRTYELGNNIYVAFFVKDGGNYRFGEVQKYNVYLLCRQALAMDLPESEKAVYLAMIDMFHKVSDYRK